MMITLNNLEKSFVTLRGRFTAIQGIDLIINPGELFVLLGPSGCGKSTLLNLLAGLEKPSAGEIKFGDRVIASEKQKTFLSPRERNVAMVFQSYALYPHMTVEQNISFPLKISGEPKPKRMDAIHEAAEILEISNLLDRRPGELSGGQRQRVAIARAIVRKPGLFLLDEPLSNLDAQLRTSTRGQLKILQRKLGITTVYVTHDQHEAMTLGDRIAVMNQGKIIQSGPPLELYHQPVNSFVAGFVGSPPMNLLKGELIAGQSGEFSVQIMGHNLEVEKQNITFSASGGEKVLIGIRPEVIEVVSDQDKINTLQMELATVESLGREDLLHLIRDQVQLLVLAPHRKWKEGSDVTIKLPGPHLRVFPEQAVGQR